MPTKPPDEISQFLKQMSLFADLNDAVIAVASTNTTHLFYNTFVNGTTQNPTFAIAVHTGTGSVIDNIIANRATGIQRILGGVTAEDLDLFFNNAANTSVGVASGGNSFSGDPLFTSAVSDNHHIKPGSPAIDAASNLGFTDYRPYSTWE